MQVHKFILPTSQLGRVSQRFSSAEIKRLLCLERIHLENAGTLPAKKKQEIIEELTAPFVQNPWDRLIFALESRFYRKSSKRYACLAGLVKARFKEVAPTLTSLYYKEGLGVSWSYLYRMGALLNYTETQKRILNSFSVYQSGNKDLRFVHQDYEEIFKAALDVKTEAAVKMLEQAPLLDDSQKRRLLLENLPAKELIRRMHLPYLTREDRFEIAVDAFISPEISALKPWSDVEKNLRRTEFKGLRGDELEQELRKRLHSLGTSAFVGNAFDGSGGQLVIRYLFDILGRGTAITEDNELIERRRDGAFVTPQPLLQAPEYDETTETAPREVFEEVWERQAAILTNDPDTIVRSQKSLEMSKAESYPTENVSDLIYFIVNKYPKTYHLLKSAISPKIAELSDVSGLNQDDQDYQFAVSKRRHAEATLRRISGTAFFYSFLKDDTDYIEKIRFSFKKEEHQGEGRTKNGGQALELNRIKDAFLPDVSSIPVGLIRSALWTVQDGKLAKALQEADLSLDQPPKGVPSDVWTAFRERRPYDVSRLLLLALHHENLSQNERFQLLHACLKHFYYEIDSTLLHFVACSLPEWLKEKRISEKQLLYLFGEFYQKDYYIVQSCFAPSDYPEDVLKALFRRLFLLDTTRKEGPVNWFDFVYNYLHFSDPLPVPERQPVLDTFTKKRDQLVKYILEKRPSPTQILVLLVNGYDFNGSLLRTNDGDKRQIEEGKRRFQEFLQTPMALRVQKYLSGSWQRIYDALYAHSKSYQDLKKDRRFRKRYPEYQELHTSLNWLERKIAVWLKFPNPFFQVRAKAMLFSLGLLTSLKGLFAEETLSRIEIATGDFPFYYGCFKEIFGKDDGIRLFLVLALNSIKRSQTWTDWFDGIRFLSLSALMDNPERLSEFLQKNGPSLLKVTRDFKPMYLEG
ncbi:MAG: hypothetical protein GY866_41710, partial [Proteobacteria bacterium]|nr:hypothetical protein [Pseudomonadota bacterium]